MQLRRSSEWGGVPLLRAAAACQGPERLFRTPRRSVSVTDWLRVTSRHVQVVVNVYRSRPQVEDDCFSLVSRRVVSCGQCVQCLLCATTTTTTKTKRFIGWNPAAVKRTGGGLRRCEWRCSRLMRCNGDWWCVQCCRRALNDWSTYTRQSTRRSTDLTSSQPQQPRWLLPSSRPFILPTEMF